MQPRPTEFRPARTLVAVLSTALGLTMALAEQALADAVVRQVSGKVEVGRGEPPNWAPLAVGATVHSAERVRTGPDGRVELALESATLRVHENSLLALPPAEPDTDPVELEHGLSLFDVVRREGRRFEVRTPTVVVSVKGTRFGVEANAEAGVVSVYRGVVGVRDADATEVVETLVREGFLASGGGEIPIELDVVPAGDPWSAWEALQTGGASRSTTDAPETDLDRARASMRRATDADVLKRAAERRPEIAERLRRQTPEAKSNTAGTNENEDAGTEQGPAPASPADLDGNGGSTTDEQADGPIDGSIDAPTDRGDRIGSKDGIRIDEGIGLDDAIRSMDETGGREGMGGTDSTKDMGIPIEGSIEPSDTQRDILDMKRVDGSLESVETLVDVPTLTGGAPLPNGETTLSTDHLAMYDPRDVMMLMDAMQDMQDASGSLARPWTQSDMTNYLENQLVDQGMTLLEAKEMVEPLFR